MRLLLDTCALLWFVDGNEKLSQRAKVLIENQRHHVFVSIASFWEIVIKQSIGRLSLPTDAPTWFRRAVLPRAFNVLAIEYADVRRLYEMGSPKTHKDPFDRLIIATALERQLTIVTSDGNYPGYGVPIEW